MALRDLVIVDLLELTGSTVATAQLLKLSQPTVSRRYRSIARGLGLEHERDAPIGRRYGHAPWVRHLRRGINHHRLAHGVMRVGGARSLRPLLKGCPWADWIDLGAQQQEQWPALLNLELLDAVAVVKAPQLSGGEAAQWCVVELPPQQGGSLSLICRHDPLVLGISARVGADLTALPVA